MKKTLFFLIAFFVSLPLVAQAAGTGTISATQIARLSSYKTTVSMITIDMVADAADASFPVVDVSGVGGFVLSLCIDEGTTGTDGTITATLKLDGTDVNILGDHGTDISTAAGYACITPSNVSGDNYLAPFAGDLDFQITGGGVNSANPQVFILFGE